MLGLKEPPRLFESQWPSEWVDDACGRVGKERWPFGPDYDPFPYEAAAVIKAVIEGKLQGALAASTLLAGPREESTS